MQAYKMLGVDGKEYGPVSADVIRQWYAQRRVIASTSLRAEGDSGWKPLSEYPEFQDLLSGNLGAPASPGQPAPTPGPGTGAGQQSGLAIASLVLGILSVTCLFVLAGLPAVITGPIAFGRARKSPAKFGGGGLALAGLIMGYVSFIMTLVFMGLLLPALAQAKSRATRIACTSNLKQIGLGARIYSSDHKEIFPPDFLSMSNELNTPMILVCPADTKHTRVMSWAEFDPRKNVTYEYLKPGIDETKAVNQIIFRCPIHNNVGMGDGSVQQRPRK